APADNWRVVVEPCAQREAVAWVAEPAEQLDRVGAGGGLGVGEQVADAGEGGGDDRDRDEGCEGAGDEPLYQRVEERAGGGAGAQAAQAAGGGEADIGVA